MQFPSFHEFKSEPNAQYDPYFPSHHHTSSPPMAASVTPDHANDHYNTYQNGGYTQYSQSWSGSSTGSQPSPQPHNNYTYGPGPGPVDGGGGGSNTPTNGVNGDYYNNQCYPSPPSSNPNMSYYNVNQYDQYNYNYNSSWGPPSNAGPGTGSSPPLYQPQQYAIKNEYDMKPSPPPSHPGAIGTPYYGGNGQSSASPHHSPHLMSMTPPHQHPSMMQSPQPPPTSEWSPQASGLTNGKRAHGQALAPEYKPVKKPRASSGQSAAAKRANNRFNGMSEEEVAKKGLPDYLKPGLDIVFIGINPSMFAAYTGKYYDGPGNHFWQALYLSGILAEPMSAVDDHKLLDLGIGFTNIVPRTTRGLSDLSRKEIADGAEVLREKLCKFKPKIAVFNGKAIYEVYSGQKKFMFGRQPEPLNDGSTWLWVMPSSSARCAQLPRAVDKVPFFEALRKFRDYLNGRLPKIEDCEVVFANVSLRNWNSNSSEKAELDYNNHNQEVEEVNPNLQPFTDGTPANVPQSVNTVIEDVVRMYSEEAKSEAGEDSLGSSSAQLTD